MKFRFLKSEQGVDEALGFLLDRFDSDDLTDSPVQLFSEWTDLLFSRRDFVLEKKVLEYASVCFSNDISIFLRQVRAELKNGLSEQNLTLFFSFLEQKPSVKHLSVLFAIFKIIHSYDSDVAYHLISLLKKHSISLFLYYAHLAKEAVKQSDKKKAVELYELCLLEPASEKDKDNVLKGYLSLNAEGETSEDDLDALRWSFLISHGEGKPDATYKVAAITNVYNEKFNLPVWLKH